MVLQRIGQGTKVTATDWWNPLTDAVNANTDGITAINNTLGKATANGGISDLNTRLGAVESVNTSQGSSITALNGAVGIPWTGGTALSRIQSLETSVGTAAPFCAVYFTGATAGIAANTDSWSQGGWSVDVDATGMVKINGDPPYNYILIPSAGRYRVEYLTNHDQTTGYGACYVVKNRSISTSVARDARAAVAGGGDATWLNANNEVTLAANDRLYWGNWASVGCNIRGQVFGMKSSKVTVRKVSN